LKQILLAVCCALALLLMGCTVVNQTNSFAEMPTPEATATPQSTATPEATATPAESGLPTLPPMVQLEGSPTDAPGSTELPEPTVTPSGSPSGING
jgi:hypothetical protein